MNEHVSDPAPSVGLSPGSDRRPHLRGRGQVLVIFVFALGALFAILALVIDVGNIWNNSLHVQQAAEAAAMAGVPSMPGDFPTASVEGDRRGPAERLLGRRWRDGDAGAQRRVEPPPGRDDLPLLRHVLPADPRDRHGAGHPHGDRRVHPAGADGQPAQRVRRQLRELLGGGREPGRRIERTATPTAPTTTRTPTLNNQYDYRGYQYAIEVPVGAGATNIDLYDPTFCAVDANKGTGDHWIPWNQATWPAVSTYYTLWSDPAETPLDYTDDVQVASTGNLFENKRQVDKSATYRDTNASWSTPYSGLAALPDCTADAYHNKWWTFTTRHVAGHLPAAGDDDRPAEPQRPEGHERREHVGPPRRRDEPGLPAARLRPRQDGDLRQRHQPGRRTSTSAGSRPSTPARRWSSSSSIPVTHRATRASRSSSRRPRATAP